MLLRTVSDLSAELRCDCAQVADAPSTCGSSASERPRTSAACRSTLTAGSADPEAHLTDGTREQLAAFWLTLDAINFGSGWFPTLRKRQGSRATSRSPPASATGSTNEGPWSAAELAEIGAAEVAAAARPGPRPRADGAVRASLNDLGATSPTTMTGGSRRVARRAPAVRPWRSSSAWPAGTLRRRLALRRPRRPVPQARPDRRRRPVPRRGGRIPRPRPPDHVRRQPRPACPAA